MKYFALILFFISSNLFGQDTLQTSQLEMNGWANLYFNDPPMVIRDKESLDSCIRKDASSEWCHKFLKELDMSHSSILGINLNSGHCRIPAGLEFNVVKQLKDEKYIVQISYEEPIEPCRALSSYNLWIKVPSLPGNYEVEFIVTPLPYQE